MTLPHSPGQKTIITQKLNQNSSNRFPHYTLHMLDVLPWYYPAKKVIQSGCAVPVNLEPESSLMEQSVIWNWRISTIAISHHKMAGVTARAQFWPGSGPMPAFNRLTYNTSQAPPMNFSMVDENCCCQGYCCRKITFACHNRTTCARTKPIMANH